MADEMSSGEIINISAEDGTVIELEYVDTFEYGDKIYVACLPLTIGGEKVSEDSEDYGFVILRIEEEDGEQYFVSPDTDEEEQGAYDKFIEELFAEEDEELDDEAEYGTYEDK